jgi:hypothetical protein
MSGCDPIENQNYVCNPWWLLLLYWFGTGDGRQDGSTKCQHCPRSLGMGSVISACYQSALRCMTHSLTFLPVSLMYAGFLYNFTALTHTHTHTSQAWEEPLQDLLNTRSSAIDAAFGIHSWGLGMNGDTTCLQALATTNHYGSTPCRGVCWCSNIRGLAQRMFIYYQGFSEWKVKLCNVGGKDPFTGTPLQVFGIQGLHIDPSSLHIDIYLTIPDPHLQTMTKSDKPAEPSITNEFNLDSISAHLYSNVSYKIENGVFSIIGKTSCDRKGELWVDHTGEVGGTFDGHGHTRIPTGNYKKGRLSAFCLHDRSKALSLYEDHPPRTSHKNNTLLPLTSIEPDGCSEGIHTVALGLISDSYTTDTPAMAYGNGLTPTILPTIINTSVYSEVPIPSPSVPGSPQSTAASAANPSQGNLGAFKDECYF